MPHLSPLNWMITPIMLWTSLLFFITASWWQQTPKFPQISKQSMQKPKPWKWN